MTQERISLVTLDIAGTSVDEGGAVYVALRDTVEKHLGEPIPDDRFDRWKGTGKRQAIEGLLRESGVPAEKIRRRRIRFHRNLLAAYRTTPPTALPGLHGRIRRAARARHQDRSPDRLFTPDRGTAAGAGRLGDRAGHRRCDHERPGADEQPVALSDLPCHGNRWSAERREVLVAGDTPNDLRAGTNAGARYVVGVLTGAHDAATLRPEPHTHILASAATIPELLGCESR